MTSSYIEINGHRIGQGYPVYIVAELSANHHQSYDEAVKLVIAAKAAGADAVKLQTYTPDTMTLDIDSDIFKCNGLWEEQDLYGLYSTGYMPWEWQPGLKKLADELEIDFFSTPFDETAADFLEGIDVPAYKIASFELVDIPLILYIAGKGKPVILSTGMATLPEIEEAVESARRANAKQIVLLKCTSTYPAMPEEMQLNTMPYLSERFDLPVGLSDHTQRISSAIAAVSMGACLIEKHFTLSRSVPSPDSAFSLEPAEFKEMVYAIRNTSLSPCEIKRGIVISERESENRKFRRSLFCVKDIKKGELLTKENTRSIRPGYGLHPRHFKDIIGRRVICDIQCGTPLKWDMLSDGDK